MIGMLLRHTGVLISIILLSAGLAVSALVGLLMAMAGASVRPAIWFAGLFAIVVLPQLAYHIYDAVQQDRLEAPLRAALADITGTPGGGAADRAREPSESLAQLFGPDVDAALVNDVRNSFGGVFADAEDAQFAVFASGETALLARFRDARALERAWTAYLATSGLRTIATGDSRRGFAASRPAGDRVYVLPMTTLLGIWSGPDDAAIRARMVAGQFDPPRDAPLADSNGEQPTGTSTSTRSDTGRMAATSLSGERPAAAAAARQVPVPLKIAATFALVMITVAYFFKGAAWAGGIPPAAVRPAAAEELRTQLLAINDLDVPFTVTAEPGTNRVAVTWRYADAKWIDLARVRGMRHTHRVVLMLDDRSNVARVTDFASSYDWSAGRGGANVQWRGMTGITFFAMHRERVFGLQLADDGRFTSDLSYTYRFDLQEMKAPLIAAITGAGWEWRPVLWADAPPWLRWLTE